MISFHYDGGVLWGTVSEFILSKGYQPGTHYKMSFGDQTMDITALPGHQSLESLLAIRFGKCDRA